MKTALLGYGVVGSGTHALLDLRPEHGITAERVLVRRDIASVRAIATRDFSEILSDPSIETVVEVMGGEEPAFSYVKAALLAKKNVITANKLLILRILLNCLFADSYNGSTSSGDGGSTYFCSGCKSAFQFTSNCFNLA